MKIYLSLTRSSLAAVTAAVILAVLLCGSFYSAVSDKNADTNTKRVSFIEALGVTCSESAPNIKTVTIPEKFSDVYERYNLIQKKAGYDLSPYNGSKVTVYGYDVIFHGKSGNFCVTLIVYNGRVIGGDISSSEINGIMLPLSKLNSE